MLRCGVQCGSESILRDRLRVQQEYTGPFERGLHCQLLENKHPHLSIEVQEIIFGDHHAMLLLLHHPASPVAGKWAKDTDITLLEDMRAVGR